MLAAATGSANAASGFSKTSSRATSGPSCCFTSAFACAESNGATWSRRVWSASRYAGGRRSGRIATAWPTLTNAGPCSAMRSLSAAARFGALRSTVASPAARSERKPAAHPARRASSAEVRFSEARGRRRQYARIFATS